ncbi:hypothetical protein B0J17DRAFT_723909 [Rhizoctonia solani]|nr:hypothetical protein B0J17DRAFT_723909 [Rhizoctonia solani]
MARVPGDNRRAPDFRILVPPFQRATGSAAIGSFHSDMFAAKVAGGDNELDRSGKASVGGEGPRKRLRGISSRQAYLAPQHRDHYAKQLQSFNLPPTYRLRASTTQVRWIGHRNGKPYEQGKGMRTISPTSLSIGATMPNNSGPSGFQYTWRFGASTRWGWVDALADLS